MKLLTLALAVQARCMADVCLFSYFFIFPLLTYCRPRYIYFAQDGRRKRGRAGSGSDPKLAVYTRRFLRTFFDLIGLARRTSYTQSNKLLDFFCEKS